MCVNPPYLTPTALQKSTVDSSVKHNDKNHASKTKLNTVNHKYIFFYYKRGANVGTHILNTLSFAKISAWTVIMMCTSFFSLNY